MPSKHTLVNSVLAIHRPEAVPSHRHRGKAMPLLRRVPRCAPWSVEVPSVPRLVETECAQGSCIGSLEEKDRTGFIYNYIYNIYV